MKKRFLIGLRVALILSVFFELGGSGVVLSSETAPLDSPSPVGPVATARILFEPAQKADDGMEPTVAMNNNNFVVQVHKSQDQETLWSRPGKVNPNNTVSWLQASSYLDKGRDPAVTMNDKGQIIEIHRGDSSYNLWYHCGLFNAESGSIGWGPATKMGYSKGVTPSVSLCNKTSGNATFFVMVHRGDDSSNLYYRCGTYHSDNTLQWTAEQYYDRGYDPSIAMNDNGFIVEVHKGDDSDNLWYNSGQYNFSNGTIQWSGHQQYDEGVHPSVAFIDNQYVLETHQSQDELTLWYRVGQIQDNGTVDWGPSWQFEIEGIKPVVAANGNYAVQMHHSQDAQSLWYSSALVIDHSRWMEDLRDDIGEKPLWQITFPGTHDAGMYTSDCDILIREYSFFEKIARDTICNNWTHTQNRNIFQQLTGGIRYFDLRPAEHDDKLYIYHSFAGPKVYTVFEDVGAFMNNAKSTGAGELVILVLSHMYHFKTVGYQKLTNYINTYLKPYLYTVEDPENTNLLTTAFNQYTQVNGVSTPRVLFLVKSGEYDDWVNSGIKPPEGVWPYQEMSYNSSSEPVTGSMRIVNDYANTPDYSTMERNQLMKLEFDKGGNDQRMFLLSWTLTAPDIWWWWRDRILNGIPPQSIHQMSTYAKPYLAPFLRTYSDKYMINHLFSDYYEETATPDLAYLMNQGLLTDPPGPPALDIKANGQDDPLLIRPETPVSITVSLNPGYRKNLNADWWIAVNTPKGWYSYVNSIGWQEGLKPYDQTILTDLSPPLELPGVSMGTGLHTYYFAIDDNADGIPDARWVDRVDVSVTCWR